MLNRASDAEPSAPGDWLTPGRFAAGLGLLIFAAFPQVLVGAQTFVVRDYGFFAYPLASFQRECFWRGELPLWNPYNNCGVPFLAQWNTMPLYPPALIYLLLPLSWSLSFFCLLHLFWAGLGMYFLAHRWTGSRLAASIAGLIFAFNGLSLNFLMWPSHIATFSWMPWVVLTVEQGWRDGGRYLLVATACGALQMLAGGPETILLTWLLLSGLWVFQVRQGRAALWRFPLIVLLVAGLAAIQLLPFLDLAAHSQRDPGYADTRWSMPGSGWANYLVPMAFGQVWSMGVFFQHDQGWTSSYYVGVGTLLLAGLGLCTVRQWRVWLLTAAAVVAFIFALGDQTIIYRGVRSVMPQLSLMTYPVKFVILITFVLPLLAGFGAARLQSAATEDRSRLGRHMFIGSLALLVLIAVVLFWASHSPRPGDSFSLTLRNGLVRAGFLVLISGTLWALSSRRRKEAENSDSAKDPPPHVDDSARSPRNFRGWGPALLLVLFWLDVWSHEPSQNPTAPPFIYTPGLARMKAAMNPQPELGQSRAMLTPAAATKFREFLVSDPKDNFLVKRLGFFADCNLLDGVPKVDGFFSICPRESGELLSVLYGATNAFFPPLTDFMAVSQITAPGEFFKWMARDSYLPLITIGPRPIYLEELDLLRGVLATNFDPRQMVLLPREAQSLVTITNPTHGRVLSTSFKIDRVEAEVDAQEPSLVVIAQTYFHPWHAYVDDRPQPLLRANYAFQAVQVPAGRHHLRLVYEDRSFRYGALVSGIFLATVAAAVLACRRGRHPAARNCP